MEKAKLNLHKHKLNCKTNISVPLNENKYDLFGNLGQSENIFNTSGMI